MAGGCHPLCGHHPKSHAHRPCRCGRVPSAVPAILAVQPPSSSSSPSPVIFRAVVATAMAVLHVVVLVARLSVLSCPPPPSRHSRLSRLRHRSRHPCSPVHELEQEQCPQAGTSFLPSYSHPLLPSPSILSRHWCSSQASLDARTAGQIEALLVFMT